MERNLICIGCPVGCRLTAKIEDDRCVKVSGNTCKRGEDYARKEVTNPTRIVTSTVRVAGRNNEVLPVKTRTDIPKDKIFECMKALRKVEVKLPIEQGMVVLENVAETGIDVVAVKSMSGAVNR